MMSECQRCKLISNARSLFGTEIISIIPLIGFSAKLFVYLPGHPSSQIKLDTSMWVVLNKLCGNEATDGLG